MDDGLEYSFYNSPYSKGCPGCNRIETQSDGLQIILETASFRVHQDYVLAIPGMMVIESKRHVSKLEDLTNNEKIDLMSIWDNVSKAIRSLGFKDITHVLEDKSSHFHLWLMPVHEWMIDVTSGKLRNIQIIFDEVKSNRTSEETIAQTELSLLNIKSYLDSN